MIEPFIELLRARLKEARKSLEMSIHPKDISYHKGRIYELHMALEQLMQFLE